MILYRAIYRTPTGPKRATFAAACRTEAERYAALLRQADTLETAETLRACERPIMDNLIFWAATAAVAADILINWSSL